MLSVPAIALGQRLFAPLVCLVLLAGAFAAGHRTATQKLTAQHTQQALAQAQAANQQVQDALAQGSAAVQQLAGLQNKVAAERRDWKEKLRATPKPDLARCLYTDPAAMGQPGAAEPPTQAASAAGGGRHTRPADGGGVELSAVFLGLYNEAWCASAGSADAAVACRAAAQATGPGAVGPRRLLEHTEQEAASCATDRQRLARLVDLLASPPWAGPAKD
jgi:hypothetical protein